VRAAQKGIPTGAVYKQNEERLIEVGGKTLQGMLMGRCWDGLPIHTKGKMVNKAATQVNSVEATSPKCPIDHASLIATPSSTPSSPSPSQSPKAKGGNNVLQVTSKDKGGQKKKEGKKDGKQNAGQQLKEMLGKEAEQKNFSAIADAVDEWMKALESDA
jgi:hypothetical protein